MVSGKLPTAQDVVVREIRQAIMSRELKPGQWVRQWDLAERLKVSSVPVREALKTLEAEGQVTYEPYRGYKVVELSVEQLEEIYLARGLLEREVTRRAVGNIDGPLIQSLAASLARMDELAKAGDVLGYTEANREFHFLLFERSRLPRVCHMIGILWQNSEAYRGLIFGPEWNRLAHEDHRAILEACESGTPTGSSLLRRGTGPTRWRTSSGTSENPKSDRQGAALEMKGETGNYVRPCRG